MRESHPAPCAMGDEPLPEPLAEAQMARIAKALANPVRVRILERFADGCPRTAQEIVEMFELAQSTVSEHLRILREADLLVATHDSPRTWHCLRWRVLRQFADAVAGLAEQQPVGLGSR